MYLSPKQIQKMYNYFVNSIVTRSILFDIEVLDGNNETQLFITECAIDTRSFTVSVNGTVIMTDLTFIAKRRVK